MCECNKRSETVTETEESPLMTMFRHPDCPFECEIPSWFAEITSYGYRLSAIDLRLGYSASIEIQHSPTHKALVNPYVEEFLDAMYRGERAPRKLRVASQSESTVVLPFEEPLLLKGGVQCFHVASEVSATGGGKLHSFYGRAFVGEGRLDFHFTASTSVDDMKETWRRVLLSVRMKEADERAEVRTVS